MKLAEKIVNIMALDGVDIKDSVETLRSVTEGIDNGNYKFIVNNLGTVIGFLTWEDNYKEVYINNLFILKIFAGDSRLYKLRAFFRSAYPGKRLNWHNNKKDKMRVS